MKPDLSLPATVIKDTRAAIHRALDIANANAQLDFSSRCIELVGKAYEARLLAMADPVAKNDKDGRCYTDQLNTLERKLRLAIEHLQGLQAGFNCSTNANDKRRQADTALVLGQITADVAGTSQTQQPASKVKEEPVSDVKPAHTADGLKPSGKRFQSVEECAAHYASEDSNAGDHLPPSWFPVAVCDYGLLFVCAAEIGASVAYPSSSNNQNEITLTTKANTYRIVVKENYLGGFVSSNSCRPGETWRRGNDLLDGRHPGNQLLKAILSDIKDYELGTGRWKCRLKVAPAENPASNMEKCPHCGKDAGTWFDRQLTVDAAGEAHMPTRCNLCGRDVDEKPDAPGLAIDRGWKLSGCGQPNPVVRPARYVYTFQYQYGGHPLLAGYTDTLCIVATSETSAWQLFSAATGAWVLINPVIIKVEAVTPGATL